MKKLLLASLLSLPILSFAATSAAPANAKTAPAQTDAATQLVNKITNGQATITQTFPAIGNLEGFVVQPANSSDQSHSMVIFADKNGQYLMVGTLIDANGQNLSDQYTQQYINGGVAKAAYADLTNVNYFSEGSDKAPHKAYILIDPNCIYCHLLYQEVEPFVQQNQLQVRWIPVGFLRPTSMGKAAKLLYAKDPINVLAQNENNFDSQNESGGIDPLAQNSNDAKISAAFQKIQANTEFFNKYGQAFIGTPVILYKDQDGKPSFFSGFAKGDKLNTLVNNMSGQW